MFADYGTLVSRVIVTTAHGMNMREVGQIENAHAPKDSKRPIEYGKRTCVPKINFILPLIFTKYKVYRSFGRSKAIVPESLPHMLLRKKYKWDLPINVDRGQT